MQEKVLDALADILKGLVKRDDMEVRLTPSQTDKARIVLREGKIHFPIRIPWICQVYAPGMFPNEGIGKRKHGISYQNPENGKRIWKDCDIAYLIEALYRFRKEIIKSAQYVLNLRYDSSQKQAKFPLEQSKAADQESLFSRS